MANNPSKSSYYIQANGMLNGRMIGDILPIKPSSLSYNEAMNDDQTKLIYRDPIMVADGFKIIKKDDPSGEKELPPVFEMLFFQYTGAEDEAEVIAAVRLTDAQAIQLKNLAKDVIETK